MPVQSKTKKAFTLIELLVVVAIIGILSTVVVVSVNGAQTKAKDAKVKSDMAQIGKLAALYYNENSTYLPLNCSAGAVKCDAIPDGGNTYLSQIKLLASDVKTTLGNSEELAIAAGATSYQASAKLPSSINASTLQFLAISNSSGVNQLDTGDGLVGYWKMDEASWNGTAGEVKDSGVNNYNGTANATTTTVTGKFNKAGTFNGSNSKVVTNLSPVLSSFSVSFWMKSGLITSPGWDIVIGRGDSGNGWFINRNGGTSNLSIRIDTSTSGSGYNQQGLARVSSAYDNNWHQITFLIDQTTSKVTSYKDGVISNISPFVLNSGFTTTPALNFGYNAVGGNYNGLLDDVRLYNRILPPSEILALASQAQ